MKNLGIEEAGRNIGGKTVADYIEAAQLGLNTGLKGGCRCGDRAQPGSPRRKVAQAFKHFQVNQAVGHWPAPGD